ncbi:MAG: hypothetical protein AAGD43_03430 [Pseudomonadota bacterium]
MYLPNDSRADPYQLLWDIRDREQRVLDDLMASHHEQEAKEHKAEAQDTIGRLNEWINAVEARRSRSS